MIRNHIGGRSAVALVALSAGVLLTSCNGTGTDPEPSGTRVLLTDAPFPFDDVSRVDVFIVRVDASESADTTTPGDWINIVAPMQTFNLLDLQRGATAIVGEGAIPAGAYEAIRLVMDTDRSSITYANGQPASVRWPVAGELALHAIVEQPVDVPTEGASIVIDFDVGRSFAFMESAQDTVGHTVAEQFIFLPWIRAVNAAITGSITGTVRGDANGDGTPEPIRNATVSVTRVDTFGRFVSALATGATDAAGTFKINYLLPGTYLVQAAAPRALTLAPASVFGAVVSTDVETTVDLELGLAQPAVLEILGPDHADLGEVITFRAVVLDQNGDTLSGQLVSWVASPSGAATLTGPDGGAATGEYVLLRGERAGTVTLAATSMGLSDIATLNIRDPNAPPVATVELTPASATIAVFDSLFIVPTLRDTQGNTLTNRYVSWAVSDSTVLQLHFSNEHGASLIALKGGDAVVSATSEGKVGTAHISVR